MSEVCLSLRDLAKSYGARPAVRGISLDIERGEILGLLGPNGAGKSTTINMISGFLPPTSGEILWEGRPITAALPRWRRAIGMVLEDLALFEYLTTREHFALAGALYGLDRRETERRSEELLEFLAMREAADTVAREASQGTRKKLAFGLGIIHEPRLLFLDEALGGIDALVVKDIKGLLRTMAAGGTTIVVSSHVLDAVETLIDRCVIITGGKVALDEPMERLRGAGRSLEETYAGIVRGSDSVAPRLSWVS